MTDSPRLQTDSTNSQTSIVLLFIHSFIHSFIPSACAECGDSLPFSGASSIPLCYIPFSTNCSFILPHFILPSISWSASALLFRNSYVIPFWEFYFFPFSVHAQTNIIYLTLLSPLQWVFKTIVQISLLVNILQFSFPLSYTGPTILLYTFLSKMCIYFPTLFVSMQVSDP